MNDFFDNLKQENILDIFLTGIVDIKVEHQRVLLKEQYVYTIK